MAVVVLTAAHAITPPIQTLRGVVRLGSKTQANVDANRSSVALGQGMVMVSSNPGGLGRPAIGVSFNGAPMFAKVQGTALVAYLPGAFIEITGIEGRTYLFRKGSFGENVAIDAGKMLLVKPAANRLPDTADVNLDYLVKHSPMLKGSVNLAAWPLVARAIDKQSKNRYLKATPIYFDGAGTGALVEGESGEVSSQKAHVEGQPLSSSLTATEAVEQIPRHFAPEQLVASISSTGSAGMTAGGGGGPPGGGGVDVPGAPTLTTVTANIGLDIPPSRGFLEQFKINSPEDTNAVGTTMWFPIGFTGDREVLASGHVNDPNLQAAGIAPQKQEDSPPGLVQGVAPGHAGGFTNLVFKEARIADSQAANFKISSLGETSSVVLKFSQAEIPSDILNMDQFNQAFHLTPPGKGDPPNRVVVNVNAPTKEQPFGNDFHGNLMPIDQFFSSSIRKMPRRELTMTVPAGQTVTISDPGFFAGDTPTKPGVYGQGQGNFGEQKHGTLYGLAQPTFMGSVFVQASGKGVSVEVGDRIVRDVTVTKTLDFEESPINEISDDNPNNPLGEFPKDTDENAPKSQIVVGEHLVKGGFTFDSSGLGFGVFSLQAPAPTVSFVKASILNTAPSFRIQSDGPLQISDPGPRVLTSVEVVSKQDVGVRSTSSDGELVFSKATLHAGRAITVSSAKRIRLENSSQLNALTAVVMQGGGTAGLEVVHSTVNTPQGQVVIDQFNRIQMDSAQLTASVIKARVIGPDGVLQITNSTLSAGTLLRLYAEGYRGTVEFAGAVKLGGHTIDIAGDTVRVKANGSVTWTDPKAMATVYANTRDYNKAGFGTMENHQQKPFGARPPF
jgi:hypothetical protein